MFAYFFELQLCLQKHAEIEVFTTDDEGVLFFRLRYSSFRASYRGPYLNISKSVLRDCVSLQRQYC